MVRTSPGLTRSAACDALSRLMRTRPATASLAASERDFTTRAKNSHLSMRCRDASAMLLLGWSWSRNAASLAKGDSGSICAGRSSRGRGWKAGFGPRSGRPFDRLAACPCGNRAVRLRLAARRTLVAVAVEFRLAGAIRSVALRGGPGTGAGRLGGCWPVSAPALRLPRRGHGRRRWSVVGPGAGPDDRNGPDATAGWALVLRRALPRHLHQRRVRRW